MESRSLNFSWISRARLGSWIVSRRRKRTRSTHARRPSIGEQLEPRTLLAAQLVAHWTAATLDEGTSIDQITRNWLDQIAQIPAQPAGAPSLVPGALNGHAVVRFDASDQVDLFRIAATDSPLSGAEDFSVAVVFATDATTLNGTATDWYFNSGIVDTNSLGLLEDWGISMTQDGRVGAGIGKPARTLYSDAQGLNDGLAHVAVLTRTEETIRLYVDGVVVERKDASLLPRALREVKIGAGGLPFTGDLAEIRFYDGQLETKDVVTLTESLLDRYLNQWPVTIDDQYRMAEDEILTVSAALGTLSNDWDPEQAELTAELVLPPTQGILEFNRDGSFIYQPNDDFFGVDEFTYRADDGSASRIGTVTIEVLNQPDLPRALPDGYLGAIDQPMTVSSSEGLLINDRNPDQGTLTARLVTDAAFGNVDLQLDGGFTYVPHPGFTGRDSFAYQVDDGWSTSAPVFVELGIQRYTVIINELMASNLQTLIDDDGDSSDWVELFNYGNQTVDLEGSYLTDQFDNPARWRFPKLQIDPGEYQIIFASGKDRCSSAAACHTNFRLDSGGEFLALVEPDGQTFASTLTTSYPSQLRDRSFGLPASETPADGPQGLQFTYLAEPTPGEANAGWANDLGPLVTQVTHHPAVPRADQDVMITAQIDEVFDPVASVSLHYRLMYGAEHTVRMHDDGTHGDLMKDDGQYTVILPASVLQEAWLADGFGEEPMAGKMLRYAVTTTDLEGRSLRTPDSPTSGGNPAGPEYYGTVFGDPDLAGELPVLHWFVPDPEWHRTSTGNNTTWTSASVFFHGQFYDNLQVRVRGITTVDWRKPKLKFEFNPGDPFFYSSDQLPVDEFNLQSHFLEKGATSYMGENLAFAFLQDIGVPAPHTMHLQVQQNGQFYSLASFVEQIDETFLQRVGLDDDNPMYKANSAAARSTLAPNPSPADYQKVIGPLRSYDDLREFTAGINGLIPGIDRSTYLFDHVNLPQVINNMAGNTILTNHDRLTKNYYMYFDQSGSGEWSQFPWDMDQAFAKRTDANFSSVLYGDSEHPQATGQPIYQNHLLDAILDTPLTRQMYLRRLRTLLDDYLVAGFFEDWIAQTAPRIADLAAQDHARWGAGELDAGIARLQHNLSFRREQLLADPLVPPSNRADQATTLIGPNAPVRVRVPTSEGDSTDWYLSGRELDDSPQAGWRVGTSGVGYERGTGYEPYLGQLFVDENHQIPWSLLDDLDPDGDGVGLSAAVYTRFHFSVDDPSVFDQLELQMRYDDAFVAYLNGVEVARANFVGLPRWDRTASAGNHEAGEEFELFDLSSALDPGGAELTAGDNILSIVAINTQLNSPDLLVQPVLVGRVAIAPEFQIAFGDVESSPSSGNPDEEFFEIQNLEAVAVDLSGWRLEGAVEYAFPAGTVLPAGNSLYLSPEVNAFRSRPTGPSGGQGLFVQGPYSGRLQHAIEPIRLIDDWNKEVAQLTVDTPPSPLQQYLRVSELHYNPSGSDDATEFLELWNTSHGPDAITLDLTGVTLADGPSDPFVIPSGTELPPESFWSSPKILRAFVRRIQTSQRRRSWGRLPDRCPTVARQFKSMTPRAVS